MADYYILDHKRKAIAVDDVLVWGRWMQEHPDHHVADEKVGNARVSTVFIGLNHSFNFFSGPPLIFETMVFGGKLDGEMDRYSTWAQAEQGHKDMLERVIDAAKKKEVPKQEIPL